MLGKLNFYTDPKFVARRKIVSGIGLQLPSPLIEVGEEWPLFEARPALSAPSSAGPAFKEAKVIAVHSASTPEDVFDEPTYGDHEREIEKHARHLFADAGGFMLLMRQALAAIEDEPVTEILRQLRECPEQIADLNQSARRRSIIEVGRSRARQLDATLLRDNIIAARRAVLTDRAKAFGEMQNEIRRLRRENISRADREVAPVAMLLSTVIEDDNPPTSTVISDSEQQHRSDIDDEDFFGELDGGVTGLSDPATIVSEEPMVDEDDVITVQAVLETIGATSHALLEIETLTELTGIQLGGDVAMKLKTVAADIKASLEIAGSDELSFSA